MDSVYNTFRRWRMQAGLMPFWKRCNSSSMKGLIDFDLWCLDGSNVRYPKMLPVHVKRTSMNHGWPFAGRFRQQKFRSADGHGFH